MTQEETPKLLIAVVDDDPLFRDITSALISASSAYTPVQAASGDELFRVLDDSRIACILLDYDLGNETGVEVKKKLDLSHPNGPPVIMLTGDGRERTAIEAFRSGVSDYLSKLGLEPSTLLATITNVVANERVRLKIRADHTRLKQTASMDPVTGLFGQSHIEERLAELAKLSQEDRLAYTIFTVELSQYRSIIEYYGLGIADQALRAFAARLREIDRDGDLCGRYREGTFLVIKHYRSTHVDVGELCRRMSDFLSITTSTPFAEIKLTATVAVALCGPSSPLNLDEWLHITESVSVTKNRFEPDSPPGVTCDQRSDDRSTASPVPRLSGPEKPAWVYVPVHTS